jgi:integrase
MLMQYLRLPMLEQGYALRRYHRSIDIPGCPNIFMKSLKALSRKDRKRMVRALSGMDRILLLLLIETGLSAQELRETRVSDLNLVRGAIRARPSGKAFVLSQEVLRELGSYLASRPGQTYLFEGRCGKPVTGRWQRCVLERLLRDEDQIQTGACECN